MRRELNIGLGFSTEGGRFQRERERMLKIVLFAGSRIMRTRGKNIGQSCVLRCTKLSCVHVRWIVCSSFHLN